MVLGRRYYLLISLLCMAVPAVIALFYIAHFGRTAIYWDEWAMVPLYQKMENGSLHIVDLFAQLNEHRIFFPRVILLVIEHFSHFNTVVEMYCSWVLMCGILAIISALWFKKFGFTKESLLFFIPIPWLVFTLRQWENLLFGFQLGFFLCVFCVVFALFLLLYSDDRAIYLIPSLLSAGIASFSNLLGFIVWPAGFILILLTGKGRKIPGIWACSGFVLLLLFTFQWQRPAGHPTPTYFMQHPFSMIEYFFAIIGSPLGFGPWITGIALYPIGVGIGIVLCMCLLLFFLIKNRHGSEYAIWISLFLYTLGASLVLAVGRGGFGIEQALSSRYVTFFIPGIIACYTLAFSVSRANIPIFPLKNTVFKIIFFLLIIGVCIGFAEGLTMGFKIAGERQEMGCILMDYTHQDDAALAKLYPNSGRVRTYASILEKNKANVFYPPEMERYQRVCESKDRPDGFFIWASVYQNDVNATINRFFGSTPGHE